MRYKDETVSVKISVSPGYPEESGVKISNVNFHGADQRKLKCSEASILNDIESIINENAGEEVLFDVIEYLRKLKYAIEVDADKAATLSQAPLVETENDVENGRLDDDRIPDLSSYAKKYTSGISIEHASSSAFSSIPSNPLSKR